MAATVHDLELAHMRAENSRKSQGGKRLVENSMYTGTRDLCIERVATGSIDEQLEKDERKFQWRESIGKDEASS